MTEAELRQRCHTTLPGHRAPTPAATFRAMADWCDANDVRHDHYGNGDLISAFEQKIATLLGFEAAVFCISGTMTQSIALRLACDQRASRLVALHPTSHILRHERSNYQLLDHFDALQIGGQFRPWTLAELQAMPERLAAAVIELPMREIGGQCPSWDELQAIKQACRERDVHLHMDGARLWEAAAGFERTPAEVAAGFDSVYVSLYKGIGGLGGAMLAGSRSMVEQARGWFSRMGGNVIHRSPYVVSAAMQFDARLAAMPACFRRTRWLYRELAAYPQWRVNPAQPQANMLHLHLPVSRERAIAARNRIAELHGVWMFGYASDAQLPDQCVVELYVGDNLLAAPDQLVRDTLAQFAQALAT